MQVQRIGEVQRNYTSLKEELEGHIWRRNMRESQLTPAMLGRARIKDKETFVYFLDMEVKRARRYKDFFSMILLRLMKPASHLQDVVTETACNKLKEVLAQETRETDILGITEEGEIAILLPYADEKSAELAQHRFNDLLESYVFVIGGPEINFKRVCFPSDGTTTVDILKKALYIPS